jgi:nucleoside-diphosphate-sugar epimerase
MRGPIIVGGGRLAGLLHAEIGNSMRVYSSRSAQTVVPSLLQGLPADRPIVYAHGPAGNEATEADLLNATYAHVTLPGVLRYRYPERRIIYLSTLAVWGTYPELKRMGERVLGVDGTIVLRLGSVLSYTTGVSAIFYRKGMRGEPLPLPPGADRLGYIFLDELGVVGAVKDLVDSSDYPKPCVIGAGWSCRLTEFAQLVAQLTAERTGRLPSTIQYDGTLSQGVQNYSHSDFDNPLGDRLDTLRAWIAAGPPVEDM